MTDRNRNGLHFSSKSHHPDGTASRFRNQQTGSGALTFTVSWDVTGAEGNIKWQLFVLNRTDPRVSITGVQLTDDAGLTATSSNTMVISTGPVSSPKARRATLIRTVRLPDSVRTSTSRSSIRP